jgi:L-rhamnose isomerase
MSTYPDDQKINGAYQLAKERYAMFGVNVDQAMDTLKSVAISLHCWQGDDVGGFEDPDRALGGGLMATGNYPGKARTANELRSDLDKAYSLIPGRHRLNLHAIYLEADTKIERNAILPEHFAGWVDWAKANRHGVDFNPTLFSRRTRRADGSERSGCARDHQEFSSARGVSGHWSARDERL